MAEEGPSNEEQIGIVVLSFNMASSFVKMKNQPEKTQIPH